MKLVYRILRKPFSKQPMNGEGAYRFGGRWSSVGTRLAYTAEHLSLAMIEYLVHVDINDPPKDLVLVTAAIPETVSRKVIPLRRLPSDWRHTPAPLGLVRIGDEFARESSAAVLIVPSALAPVETNWLVNPLHPDFARIRAYPAEAFRYDPRLFQ